MATTTTPPNPRLRVRPATPADVEAILDVHFAAFGPDIMDQLMYPQGVSADARTKFGYSFFPPTAPNEKGSDDAASKPSHKKKKGELLVMVAEELPADDDSTPGQIIAFSKWTLSREPRSEEEWNDGSENETAETLGEGCDVTVYNEFIGALHRKRRVYSRGDPALFLGLLASTPTRHRTGAGSALLRWGTELADSLGLPSYLEASPYGYSLYKKFGYQEIDVLDLNITERWGAVKTDDRNWGQNCAVDLVGPAPEGTFRTVIMKRPAKTAA
ncbi:hypothetical protein B0T17DRAFT_216403 [Bombardia bombarda]|uniref:N-acetyltransferase domain-containing protein n=1 Tax=Bombardia bombarda TaxID=252184 RepID=A0AA40CAH2_9PEZI|nr:hypothetical protein B0T17DRAFT_216403 [Bombardia bombarda]